MIKLLTNRKENSSMLKMKDKWCHMPSEEPPPPKDTPPPPPDDK